MQLVDDCRGVLGFAGRRDRLHARRALVGMDSNDVFGIANRN